MSVNKSVTLVILLISSLLNGQGLTDTVAFEYLKTVQIAPIGAPLDFPAYELGVKNGLEFSFDDMVLSSMIPAIITALLYWLTSIDATLLFAMYGSSWLTMFIFYLIYGTNNSK